MNRAMAGGQAEVMTFELGESRVERSDRWNSIPYIANPACPEHEAKSAAWHPHPQEASLTGTCLGLWEPQIWSPWT